jgi:hypothetical protein
MKKRLLLLIFLICFALLCCAYSSSAAHFETAVVSQESAVGQTFTANYDGLEAVHVHLSPLEAGEGMLCFSLKTSPDAAVELVSITLPVKNVVNSGFVKFDFPPLPDSNLRDYYFELTVIGDEKLLVHTEESGAWYQGALYLNQVPADAQLAFRLSYDAVQRLFGVMGQAGGWIFQILLSGLLFILPGWALLSGLWTDWSENAFFSKIALAGGMSFALYSLLMLFTDWVGLRLGAFYAWIPVLAGGGYLFWRHRQGIASWIRSPLKRFQTQWKVWKERIDGQALTLFLVATLILLLRFWHIRNLQIPLLGDSYQHTMIVQLMLEHQGLFQSWLPYAPYESYTTHFGFHANAAVFSWMSGLTAAKSVLIVGQILNALAVFSLYPLALKLTKGNRWAGVGALLAAGVLSPLPAVYVNWGRYPQLAGQMILSAVLFFLLQRFPERKRLIPQALIVSLLLAGMMVSYYRTPMFFLAFLPLVLMVWAPQLKSGGKGIWKLSLQFLVLLIFFALIFLLPLMLRLRQGALITHVGESGQSVDRFASVLMALEEWQRITVLYPVWFLILCAAAWLLSLFRKNWYLFSLPLGVVLVQAYLFGRVINLPLAKYVQPFSVMIFVYLPSSLVAGLIFAVVEKWLAKYKQIVLSVLIIFLALWGAWRMRAIVDEQNYALVTPVDLKAFNWIDEHVSEDALFLVEGFLIYDGYSAVGADGGWWIPLLANRQNTMPPQYALLNEMPIDPGYSQWVVNVVAVLREHPLVSEQGFRYLCDWGITHIYIGQKQGMAGIEAAPLFSNDDLRDASYFELIYQEDLVRIYAIRPAFCTSQ